MFHSILNWPNRCYKIHRYHALCKQTAEINVKVGINFLNFNISTRNWCDKNLFGFFNKLQGTCCTHNTTWLTKLSFTQNKWDILRFATGTTNYNFKKKQKNETSAWFRLPCHLARKWIRHIIQIPGSAWVSFN